MLRPIPRAQDWTPAGLLLAALQQEGAETTFSGSKPRGGFFSFLGWEGGRRGPGSSSCGAALVPGLGSLGPATKGGLCGQFLGGQPPGSEGAFPRGEAGTARASGGASGEEPEGRRATPLRPGARGRCSPAQAQGPVPAVSSEKLFWEQELGCLGGRGEAKGLEADGPGETPTDGRRGAEQLPAWLAGAGRRGAVTGPAGPPLERAAIVQASGFREPDSRKDFLFWGGGQLRFQLRKGSTHAHKPHRPLQVCFSDTLETAQFRENSSRMLGPAFPERVQDCCVNTATLSKLPPSGMV